MLTLPFIRIDTNSSKDSLPLWSLCITSSLTALAMTDFVMMLCKLGLSDVNGSDCESVSRSFLILSYCGNFMVLFTRWFCHARYTFRLSRQSCHFWSIKQNCINWLHFVSDLLLHPELSFLCSLAQDHDQQTTPMLVKGTWFFLTQKVPLLSCYHTFGFDSHKWYNWGQLVSLSGIKKYFLGVLL